MHELGSFDFKMFESTSIYLCLIYLLLGSCSLDGFGYGIGIASKEIWSLKVGDRTKDVSAIIPFYP